MYIIKLVNEEDGKQYDDEQGMINLLTYIYQPAKTLVDSFRTDTLHCTPCTGCEPFIFPTDYEHDVEAVFEFMYFNNHAFGIVRTNLMKHRIISFDAAADLLPRDLDSLGRRVCQFYKREGYIAAYGVHADTRNLHVHIAVDTIGYLTGNRFSISFEKNKLYSIVQSWESEFYALLSCNEKRWAQQEEMLYGKPRYGQIALSAPEQIELVRRASQL